MKHDTITLDPDRLLWRIYQACGGDAWDSPEPVSPKVARNMLSLLEEIRGAAEWAGVPIAEKRWDRLKAISALDEGGDGGK